MGNNIFNGGGGVLFIKNIISWLVAICRSVTLYIPFFPPIINSFYAKIPSE